jgi:hypothetical protein
MECLLIYLEQGEILMRTKLVTDIIVNVETGHRVVIRRATSTDDS